MSIPFYVSYAALWMVVVVLSLVVLGLVRLVSQLQQSGAGATADEVGLKSGQIAPAFQAKDLSGASVGSEDFVGRLHALLFVSPNCPSCSASLYEMDALSHKARGNMIVVCRAGRDDCIQLAQAYTLDVRMVTDEDDAISRLFGISTFPTAVIIDERGRIQSYGQPKREELEEALEKTAAGEILEVN